MRLILYSSGSILCSFLCVVIIIEFVGNVVQQLNACLWPSVCVSGKPLSVLDGVPIAVKDEIDCLPYRTTGKRMSWGVSIEIKFHIWLEAEYYLLNSLC